MPLPLAGIVLLLVFSGGAELGETRDPSKELRVTEDLELARCVEVPCEDSLELSLEELSATKLDRDRLRRSLRKAGIMVVDEA